MPKPIQKVTNSDLLDQKTLDALHTKISTHIEHARNTIQRTVDTEMVTAYWCIGRDIVQEEQQGKARADYASYLIKGLSSRLNKQYGRGFSPSTLKDIRQFYLSYSNPDNSIGHAVRGQSSPGFSLNLGWTHYRALMRVGRKENCQLSICIKIQRRANGR